MLKKIYSTVHLKVSVEHIEQSLLFCYIEKLNVYLKYCEHIKLLPHTTFVNNIQYYTKSPVIIIEIQEKFSNFLRIWDTE